MLDVRLLAALDMHGRSGTRRRRVAVVVEFFVGVVGCAGLGVAALLNGGGWSTPLGAWLCGMGLNYVPLLLSAASLLAPGRIERELAGRDVEADLRRAAREQLWIVVPLAVVIASLARASR